MTRIEKVIYAVSDLREFYLRIEEYREAVREKEKRVRESSPTPARPMNHESTGRRLEAKD